MKTDPEFCASDSECGPRVHPRWVDASETESARAREREHEITTWRSPFSYHGRTLEAEARGQGGDILGPLCSQGRNRVGISSIVTRPTEACSCCKSRLVSCSCSISLLRSQRPEPHVPSPSCESLLRARARVTWNTSCRRGIQRRGPESC